MNPLNHTPGPWAFSLNHSGDYQLRGSNGHLVFQVSTGTIPDNSDARLIASAPELLRALEWIVDDWEKATGRTLPDDHPTKAAISKAKGRE